jgi:hypothetical protein
LITIASSALGGKYKILKRGSFYEKYQVRIMPDEKTFLDVQILVKFCNIFIYNNPRNVATIFGEISGNKF